MFAEGLYDLGFRAMTSVPSVRGQGSSQGLGCGLALLRRGRILGTDRRGSIFMGRYDYDSNAAMAKVSVMLQVAPERELVTGFAAGADGATIEIEAAISEPAAKVETMVDVAGQPVVVTLTYVGPLPN